MRPTGEGCGSKSRSRRSRSPRLLRERALHVAEDEDSRCGSAQPFRQTMGEEAWASLSGIRQALDGRMEYWLIGQMLREGLDVYVPLVDDFGIEAAVPK
jgi:hypothetical protein